jgi:hypothetical protein
VQARPRLFVGRGRVFTPAVHRRRTENVHRRQTSPTPGPGSQADTLAAVILRCTVKLLHLLRVAARRVEEHPASPEDWYANLLRINARKCLLVTHAGTLFSVFVPDVLVADLRPLGPFLVPRIQAALAAEGLPPNTLGNLDPADLRLAKTADRSVLGSMNDLAFLCKWIAADDGGLAHLDLADLHHRMQRNLSGARDYANAIDLARDRRNHASSNGES